MLSFYGHIFERISLFIYFALDLDVIGASVEVGRLTEDFYGVKLPLKIKDR